MAAYFTKTMLWTNYLCRSYHFNIPASTPHWKKLYFPEWNIYWWIGAISAAGKPSFPMENHLWSAHIIFILEPYHYLGRARTYKIYIAIRDNRTFCLICIKLFLHQSMTNIYSNYTQSLSIKRVGGWISHSKAGRYLELSRKTWIIYLLKRSV